MRGAIPLLLMLTGCSAAPGRQGGIVSTNPCADALLVALAEPAEIAAISHYSVEPGATSLPLPVARRFATTAGTAEEVIARAPRLVLASSFTPPATLAAYRRAGLRVLVLDSPTSIAASERQVLQVAEAVGVPARGRALVQAIQSAVAAARPSDEVRPAALLFIAGDLANGGGTLLDEMLRVAGFADAAAGYGLRYTGTLPIETVAAAPPAVILSPGDGRTARLRRQVVPTAHTATFDRRLVNCGGPTIIPALARLAQVRREVVR